VSNSGKADHPAIRREEDMTIDKKNINAMLDSRLDH
jgi:hypothetical protein